MEESSANMIYNLFLLFQILALLLVVIGTVYGQFGHEPKHLEEYIDYRVSRL